MKNKMKTNESNIEDNNITNKKDKKKHRVLSKILIIVLILGIATGSWFGYKIYVNGGNKINFKGLLATVVGHDEETVKNLPKLYCLITGQSQNLTDTIMVCSYDPKKQEASILSIPRDTFVGTSKKYADSYSKINALYQSGPEKTRAAVNEITGLNIKYYLNIDTKALRQVVDSIGGVYFDVPIDMDYEDCTQDLYIHVKKGYQLLDGNKAEQVVRFRHNDDGTSYPTEYGDNDLGRMKTQRAFIEAVIKKLATPNTLTKIPELIKVAEKNVTTNLPFSELKDYAPYAIEFKTENLKTETLPGTPVVYNDLWFFEPDEEEMQEVIKELFGEEDDELEDVKVEILNGSSDSKKLSDVKSKLSEMGFYIKKTGITSNTSKTMIINRTSQKDSVIDNIKNALSNVGIKTSGSDTSDVDITIIIGSDYKK